MKAIILMCAFLFSQQKPFDGTGTATTSGAFTITNPAPMAEQRKTWLDAQLKKVKQGSTPLKIVEMDARDEHYAMLDAATGKWELHGLTYDELINDLVISASQR